MRNIDPKWRLFCLNCNEYTVHVKKDKNEYLDNNSELLCECGKKYENHKLSLVPDEQITKQRERYIAYKKNELKEMTNFYMTGMGPNNILSQMFEPPTMKSPPIIEADAGLEKEKEQERQREQEIINSYAEEAFKFSEVKRNDKCLCESGKKYKQCCLSRINKYLASSRVNKAYSILKLKK